jgi:phosphopantothenoylcysteine decarboxylase/phosphopantothenate--cysteine ligase
MAHILLTSGPTRAYLDDVRYLSNASSGRMGAALARAAVALGHRVTIVSGPVAVTYPRGVRVRRVMTTREMLDTCLEELPQVDGVIAAAAPCDFEPVARRAGKLPRQGRGLSLRLMPTVDVVATLATNVSAARLSVVQPTAVQPTAVQPTAVQPTAVQPTAVQPTAVRGRVRRPWFVAFALEVGADRNRAIAKLRSKRCDLIVVNGLPAIDAAETAVCVLSSEGEVTTAAGTKAAVARRLLRLIQRRLIDVAE